jgi:hypothetical protein
MFTRSSVRVLLLGVVAIGIFLAPALAAAQDAQPAPVGGLGLGRPATPGDIQRINIDVRPDGEASSNNRESPRSLLQTPGAVSGTLRLVISRSVAAHRREKPLFVSWTPPLFLQQRCRLPRRAQTLGQRNRYALRVHAGRTRYGREVTFAQRKLRHTSLAGSNYVMSRRPRPARSYLGRPQGSIHCARIAVSGGPLDIRSSLERGPSTQVRFRSQQLLKA